MLRYLRSSGCFLVASLAAGTALAAGSQTSVRGLVRDPQGVPQMGVLVELLRGGIAASVFTDAHGFYRIDGVAPGTYDLQTSAALFLPTLKRRLRLSVGVAPVVNLTLSGLLDESGWIRAKSLPAGGDFEDWKWTLRSPANRPLLRLVNEDAPAKARDTEQEAGAGRVRRLSAGVATDFGAFGAPGTMLQAAVGQQGRAIDSRRVARVAVGTAAGQQVPFAASMESSSGRGMGMRRSLVATARSYPLIETRGATGLAVVTLASAQRVELGSMGALEVGGSSEVLHSGGTLVVFQPFAQVSVRAGGAWVVRYGYATDPNRQGAGSLETPAAEAPVLVRAADGRWKTRAGTHQEGAIVRAAGRVKLQAAIYHDAQRNTVLSGKVLAGQPTLAGAAVDAANGSIRWMQGSLVDTGARVGMEMPLGGEGHLTAGYVSGTGMSDVATRGGTQPSIAARRGSAMYVVVTKAFAHRGTELTAGYRWQRSSLLTTIAPFDHPECAPYLGLHVTQQLPAFGRSSAKHTAITIDGSNVLAEGYRDAAEMLGSGAQLMSSVRELRAGFSVTF